MRKLSALFILPLLLLTALNIAGQTPLKMRDASIQGPQTFAIIMGISKYKYVRPLAYADRDAELFRDYLKSPGGGSVKEENLYCLLNEKANSSNFWGKGFQWLKAKNLQKGDRLFIYLAGHGDAIDEDQFFFLSYDCNPLGDKNNYLVAGTIQLYNLKKKIAAETTKGVEVFFIMDACRSNELPGGTAGQNFLNTAISEKRVGETIMLATGAGQESLEDASIGNGHGLFTYYLVDGLTGSAENAQTPDNKITYQEIQSYVNKNVPSVAQQQFKRKQDPYFCCNENTEKVISTVDTAYLSKWLKTKKQQNRGPGNSFNGNNNRTYRFVQADTTLLQTYDLFNKAIADNNLTGKSSAEYYYETMNTKYAGNPYTLDAKSTLAVEFINLAQDKVSQYLGCQADQSSKQKQEFYESGLRLERAIKIIGEDDADYARALMGRMYLLKASGDFGKEGKNGDISFAFQNAYAALGIDPNGAYIQNKLAMLHLENNKKDSAIYYANKATKTAPNWACALTTLALIQKATSLNQPSSQKKIHKSSFGVTLGSGITKSSPTYSGNANTGYIGVDSKSAGILQGGIFYYINFGKRLSIRPMTAFVYGNTELFLSRRNTTGGGIIRQIVTITNTSINFAVPLIIKFADKRIAPYIGLGPSFSYTLGQDNTSTDFLPLKKSLLFGDGSFGVDCEIIKTGIIISPELKYSAGFTDMKDNTAVTNEAAALSTLKKNTFTLSIYIRKK